MLTGARSREWRFTGTSRRRRGPGRKVGRPVVVGEDPFTAFVEVIGRLQEGGMVALLLTARRSATGVAVEFSDARSCASVAATELARPPVAAVLPVYIVRTARTTGHALELVTYDRRTLGNRETGRVHGRILRALEPAVRRFPTNGFTPSRFCKPGIRPEPGHS